MLGEGPLHWRISALLGPLLRRTLTVAEAELLIRQLPEDGGDLPCGPVPVEPPISLPSELAEEIEVEEPDEEGGCCGGPALGRVLVLLCSAAAVAICLHEVDGGTVTVLLWPASRAVGILGCWQVGHAGSWACGVR